MKKYTVKRPFVDHRFGDVAHNSVMELSDRDAKGLLHNGLIEEHKIKLSAKEIKAAEKAKKEADEKAAAENEATEKAAVAAKAAENKASKENANK